MGIPHKCIMYIYVVDCFMDDKLLSDAFISENWPIRPTPANVIGSTYSSTANAVAQFRVIIFLAEQLDILEIYLYFNDYRYIIFSTPVYRNDLLNVKVNRLII